MKRILFFIIVMFVINLNGFTQSVNANISVTPPYTAMLEDYFNYPNKINITLTHMVPVGGVIDLWLKATITNDNGIEINSNPEYKQHIYLSPGAPRILNYTEIKEIFDVNRFNYSGITKNDVINKGLPSGNYRMCIRAYTYTDDVPLSAEEPMGCFSFSIFNEEVEPPVIIQPLCGTQLDPSGLQMVLFSWFKPQNSPKYFLYNFKLVECFPRQSPNDAMNSATYPYFY